MYGKPVDILGGRQGCPDSSLLHTYEIESMLGSGGCGDVYKAWHKRLQKHIVLKKLKDSSQKAIEVRRNEIEALKNIKSLYIPQVFDFLTEQEESFTVMEFVEGDSLDKVLADGRGLAESRLVKWYYQLATALEALHQKDVCHRDIKPANIILKPDGDVCLIDFNSAFVRGNNTRVVSRSLGYASPEQLAYFQMCENVSRESISDIRSCRIDWKLSDIYSLGATMFHLYTGNRPYMAADTAEAVPMVREGMAGLEGIIERSMRTQPAERFVSARELRLSLLRNHTYKTSSLTQDLPC